MPYPEKLLKSLRQYDESLYDEILSINPEIKDKDSKKIKTEFMEKAMKRIDEQLNHDEKLAVLNPCACCLSGARLKNTKAFKKKYADIDDLEELVTKLREEGPFQNHVTKLVNGQIIDGVDAYMNGRYVCACGGIDGTNENINVSDTFCYCCMGHFKFYLELALDKKIISQELLSSPLSSGGEKSCRFSFTLED